MVAARIAYCGSLRARDVDELRQDRGEEDDALGIGDVHEKPRMKTPRAVRRVVVAVLLEAARGRAPGDDAEVDEVGHAQPTSPR